MKKAKNELKIKIGFFRFIRKIDEIKNLIYAIIELVKYARTFTSDSKLSGIIAQIRINLEGIFDKNIDEI